MMWNSVCSPITRLFIRGFLLIGFLLLFSSCTPTNETLAELTGEALATNTKTVNGPLGNSALTFSPSSYNFPTLMTNGGSATHSFTVTNASSFEVILGTISGTNAQYSLTANGCTNGLIFAPGNTCTFTVKFEPTLSGPLSTAIVIPYDATPGTNSFSSSVNLTGAGSTLTSFAGLDSLSNETPVTMKLNWTDAVGASFYQIYRINGGVPTLVASVLATTNCLAGACTYTAGGLSPLTSYTFRVRATDAFGVQEQNLVNRTSTTTNGYLALTGNPPALNFCAPFTITVKDITQTPVNVATDTAITIGGVGNGLTYLDANCVFASTTPTVDSGTSAKIFYFKDLTLETVTLTADLNNFTTTTKSAIIFDPLATAIVLSPVSGSTSNTTNPSITLTLPANDLNLGATATIYSAAGCATPVGSAAIATTTQAISLTLSTQTTYTFYYKIFNATSTSPCTTTGVTYTLDTTAPTIAIVAPATSYLITNFNQFAITVSGTCSENTRNVSILATGTGPTSTSGSAICIAGNYSTTLDLSTIGEGAVILTATHTDLAGNSTTSPTAAGTGLKATCQASSTVITTTTSITYNIPANCTYITVEAWGGGGGSAGTYNAGTYPIGGGGGFISGLIPVDTTNSQVQSFTATVGAGGAAGGAGVSGSFAPGAGGGGGASGLKNGTVSLIVAGGGGGSGGFLGGYSGASGGPGGGTTGSDGIAGSNCNFPGLGGVWNGALRTAGATNLGNYPVSLINGGAGGTPGSNVLGGAGGTGLGNGGAGGNSTAFLGGGGGGGGLYAASGGGGGGCGGWSSSGGGGGASGVTRHLGIISGLQLNNTQAIASAAAIGNTATAINDYATNASGTAGNGGMASSGTFSAGAAGKSGLIVIRTYYDNTKPVTPPGIFIISTASAISLTASWTAAADNIGGSGIATYQIAIGSSAGATDYLTYDQGNVGNTLTGTISNFILPVNTTVYPSIRAIDYNGNVSTAVNGTPYITSSSFKFKIYPTLSTSSTYYYLAVPSAGMNVTVKAWGAGGGNQGQNCYNPTTSGGGGFVKDTISTAGLTFFAINAGSPGIGAARLGIGGGGGAASTIRGNAGGIVWAGGGGGSGCQDAVTGGNGGAGGGTSGTAGTNGGDGPVAGGGGTSNSNGTSPNFPGLGGGAVGSVGGRGANTTSANAGGAAGINPDAAGGLGGNGTWAFGNFGGGGGGGGYYPGGGGGTGWSSAAGGGGGSSFSPGTPTYTSGAANVAGGSPANGNDPDYLGTTGAGTTVSMTSGSAGMVVICNAGGC